MQPVGGDQHQAGADGIRRVPERAPLVADHDLAGLGSAHSGQAVEQLLLALSFQRCDAEHLAEAKRERHAVQRARPQVANLNGDTPGRGRARRGGLGGDLIRDRSEHQLDDALLAALRGLDHAHGPAIPQHGGAVAQRRHFSQPVRDEDDRTALGAQLPRDVEDADGQVRGEGRGDLIEEQQLRLDRQRAGEVQQAQGGSRQLARHRLQVEPIESELGQVMPEPRDRRGHQLEVLQHREVGQKRGILVDADEPGLARLGRRPKRPRTPAEGDRSTVRRQRAREDLHERALARAVCSHQGVDLATAHTQVGGTQRDDGSEILGEPARLEHRARVGYWSVVTNRCHMRKCGAWAFCPRPVAMQISSDPGRRSGPAWCRSCTA